VVGGIIVTSVLVAMLILTFMTTNKDGIDRNIDGQISDIADFGRRKQLNVRDCNRGTATSWGPQGSTHYRVFSIYDGKCIFQIGYEVENPTYQGEMFEECAIPTDVIVDQFDRFSNSPLNIAEYCKSL
jgi:hypothetical protein